MRLIEQSSYTPNPEVQAIVAVANAENDIAYFWRQAATWMTAGIGGIVMSIAAAKEADVSALPVCGISTGVFIGCFTMAASSIKQANRLSELKPNLKFHADMSRVQKAIERSREAAPLESQALHARLNFVQSRRTLLFQKAFTVSQLPSNERRKAWRTIYPILSELKPEIQLLPVDAEACNEFLKQIHSPNERYNFLQMYAHQELKFYERYDIHDLSLIEQYKLLESVVVGTVGPSQVTFFDILHASEQIRQGRSDITRYKIKG